MDSTIFAQLQLGITFDKKRFKKEVDIFEGTAPAGGQCHAMHALNMPNKQLLWAAVLYFCLQAP